VELARALKLQQKLITSAIAVYYKDQFSDEALAQYDFVNVMCYDRTGPWRPELPGQHSYYADAVEDLEYFGTERNIPTIKKKTELAMEKVSGIMIWQVGEDARGSKSLLKVIYRTACEKK